MRIEEIKADLKEIQYYYAHEKEFTGGSQRIGKWSIVKKTDRKKRKK